MWHETTPIGQFTQVTQFVAAIEGIANDLRYGSYPAETERDQLRRLAGAIISQPEDRRVVLAAQFKQKFRGLDREFREELWGILDDPV